MGRLRNSLLRRLVMRGSKYGKRQPKRACTQWRLRERAPCGQRGIAVSDPKTRRFTERANGSAAHDDKTDGLLVRSTKRIEAETFCRAS